MRNVFTNFANILLLSGIFIAGGGANLLRAEALQEAKTASSGVVSDADGTIASATHVTFVVKIMP